MNNYKMVKISKKNNPRINVIIPTKDRSKFLNFTLKTCILQTYSNLRVIVADDNSSDNTEEIVRNYNSIDSRIEYHKINRGSGMRDNFEYAISLVQEGYILALGSDDGLLPDGIKKLAKLIEEKHYELYTWSTPVFFYPEVNSGSSELLLNHYRKPREINSSEFLRRQENNLSYVSDPECPMFYVKGIASYELIKKIQECSPNGRFYQSSTPDGYSGIVLAGFTESFYYSDEPYTLHGVSPKSQGLGYLANDSDSKKNSEEFFKNASEVPMHPRLASQPYSPLISLMTADFLYTAADLNGWMHKKPVINIKNLVKKSLNELSHGIYSLDRMPREIDIIRRIAMEYDLESWFVIMLKKTKKRNAHTRYSGNGINNYATFIDLTPSGIVNIEQAAFAASALRFYNVNFLSFNIFRILYKSIAHYFGSKKSERSLSDLCQASDT